MPLAHTTSHRVNATLEFALAEDRERYIATNPKSRVLRRIPMRSRRMSDSVLWASARHAWGDQ